MHDNSLPPAGRLLQKMPQILNQRRTRNITATFAFKLGGVGGGDFTLKIERGNCYFQEGLVRNPTVTISSPAQVWIDLATGSINPLQAIKSGLKINGRRLLMLRFNSFFSGDPVAKTVPDGLYAETENEREVRQGKVKPPRRVLGIQASPRAKGGTTELCYRSFESGLTDSGAIVDTIYLSESDIKGCTGCYACWKVTDGQCVIQDDMTGILKKIPECDLVVIATPLYIDSLPGKMKTFLDRTIPLCHPYIFNKNGRCLHPSRFPRLPNIALVSVCGFYELENFSPLLKLVEAAAVNLHMPLIATLLRPHTMILDEDIPVGPVEQVITAFREAGKELGTHGSVSRQLKKAVSQPLISRKRFLGGAKTWWMEAERVSDDSA